MDPSPDFEDLLDLFGQHAVRYLIVGGLAFVFHAKPRYTKDLNIWIDPADENVRKANAALAQFGSPLLLAPGKLSEITQLGVPPNRIDLLLDMEKLPFEDAWAQRVEAPYGRARANWIGLEHLLRIKESIDRPHHQEDARVLKLVLQQRAKKAD